MELARFERLRKEWARSGHPCGKGSRPENTGDAAEALIDAVSVASAKSIIDLGCGLSNWVPHSLRGNGFRRLDLIAWDDGVEVFDFMSQRIPKCDLAILRFVLIHHPESSVVKALQSVKKSAGALLATTFPGSEETGGGNYWRPDLSRWIGEPDRLYSDHNSNLGLWLWR